MRKPQSIQNSDRMGGGNRQAELGCRGDRGLVERHQRQGKEISRPSGLGHDVLGSLVHTARTDVLQLSSGGNQHGDEVGWVSQFVNHAPLKHGDETARNFSYDELSKNGYPEFRYRPPK